MIIPATEAFAVEEPRASVKEYMAAGRLVQEV